MSAEIVNLDDRLTRNFKTIHNSQVSASIDSIKKNLNATSIDILLPFVIDCVLSPEFICRVRNEHLWAMQDAINSEVEYREEEGVA